MEMAKQQQQVKGRGMGGGGGGPAPFLVKTYEMVEEEGTEAVVSWGTEGASFIVWKPVEFARDLLPARFKHNNFSSFVRQLNTYGFRKVVPDRWEFANDNFRRGQRAMLSEIRRRKPPPSSAAKSPCAGGGPPSSTSNSGEVHSPSSTSSSPPPAKQQLLQLSSENEKLKNDNRLLSSELAQAKKHCEELLGFLSGYMDVSQLNISLSANEKDDDDEEEENKECNDVDDDEEETQETVKLFGVVMRRCNGEEEEKKRKKAEKRPRCDEGDGSPLMRAQWRRTETAFKC